MRKGENMAELKKTPLFDYYQANQVKLVDFGGWAMPMQFSSIIKEHQAVRQSVGMFDCSHMGEILITGPEAEPYLNSLVTNDISRMADYDVQYNIICQDDGGAVDDVMVYRFHAEKYWVVCNASNTEKVWQWLKENKKNQHVELENVTQTVGLLAVQGPQAEMVMQTLTTFDLKTLKRHKFSQSLSVGEVANVLVSRTGYTGEDGFELYIPAQETPSVWEQLLKAGTLACGLGSRDTLRLEAGLPLYGHELTETISPIMAGLGFAVKTDKQVAFKGQAALTHQHQAGPVKKIVGFQMLERGIPRQDYLVFSEKGQEIGYVTSGTQSPSLKKGIGMALVDSDQAQIGQRLLIEIRNKKIPAEIIKKPFYKKD